MRINNFRYNDYVIKPVEKITPVTKTNNERNPNQKFGLKKEKTFQELLEENKKKK